MGPMVGLVMIITGIYHIFLATYNYTSGECGSKAPFERGKNPGPTLTDVGFLYRIRGTTQTAMANTRARPLRVNPY